jgi:tripartite-type tricarboxylate transporter receptor subunit TctC
MDPESNESEPIPDGNPECRLDLVYALAPCLAVLMLDAFVGPAQGQATDYPNRPVRIVVPYAAGGPTDFIARGTAEKLSPRIAAALPVPWVRRPSSNRRPTDTRFC